MAELLNVLRSWLSFLQRISISNLVEIIIIAFLIYEILYWIKNTRAWTLLKGLAVILAFMLLAALFELRTILWLLDNLSVPLQKMHQAFHRFVQHLLCSLRLYRCSDHESHVA